MHQRAGDTTRDHLLPPSPKRDHHLPTMSSSLSSSLNNLDLEGLYAVEGDAATTATSAGDILAEELNQLTVKERNDLYEEIHGIQGSLQPETPEFLQEVYAKLDQSLTLLPTNKRQEYDRALFLKPSLIRDRPFHLIFLRCCRYQSAQTATRICSFFRIKLQLFGDAKLVKKITQDDLSEDDRESMHQSRSAVLTETDRSGRIILVKDVFNMHCKEAINYVRQIWYQSMVATERIEAQLNGVVMVDLGLGTCRAGLKKLYDAGQLVRLLLDGIPLRLASQHFCTDDPRVLPLVKIVQMVAGKDLRLRSRVHFGSRVETEYTLRTFGIQMPSPLLLDDSSTAYHDIIDETMKARKLQEQNQALPASQAVGGGICRVYPSPEDVLCGRGRPYYSFAGNHLFLSRIERQLPRYLSIKKRSERTAMCMRIVEETQEAGGRFVKRVPSQGWEEVDDPTARVKVSEILRRFRQKQEEKEAEPTSWMGRLLGSRN